MCPWAHLKLYYRQPHVTLCCALKSAAPLLYVLLGGAGTSPSPLFLSGQDGFALLQLLRWFPLFQNSMIPAGLAWEDMLYPLYQKYKNAITWGDQDLLNIIFYFNPGRWFFQNVICILVYPPQPIEPGLLLRARAVPGAPPHLLAQAPADTKTKW